MPKTRNVSAGATRRHRDGDELILCGRREAVFPSEFLGLRHQPGNVRAVPLTLLLFVPLLFGHFGDPRLFPERGGKTRNFVQWDERIASVVLGFELAGLNPLAQRDLVLCRGSRDIDLIAGGSGRRG